MKRTYKHNKYNSRQTVIDGILFDSKKEAERYGILKLMQKQGIITDLQTQVKFVLVPAQYEEYPRYGKRGKPLKPGKRCLENELAYIADFVYRIGNETVVEDVKGFKTKEYKIKRKLMLYIHGIRIMEV